MFSLDVSFTVKRGLACCRLLTCLAWVAVSVVMLPILLDSLKDSKSAGCTCLIELLKLSVTAFALKRGAGYWGSGFTWGLEAAICGEAVGEVSN